MTQEEKALLLKDLCARLPYNPMVEYKGETYNVLGIVHERLALCKPPMSYTLDDCPLVKEVKPYLFPQSSMTEEQQKDLAKFVANGVYDENIVYDWFNKNHFDYRGLIPMGLANNATGLNIYSYEQEPEKND